MEGGITIGLDDAFKYGSALVAVGIAWATMRWKAQNAHAAISALDTKVTKEMQDLRKEIAQSRDVNTKHNDRINVLERDMSVIKNDLEHIKKGQDEIKDLLIKRQT